MGGIIMNFIDFLVLLFVVIAVGSIIYFKYFFHRHRRPKGCSNNPTCRSCAKSQEILADEMHRQYEREKRKAERNRVREMHHRANISQADIDMLNEKKDQKK